MNGDQSETATRKVAENTAAGQAIGDPLVAEDEDGDILTYTLSGTDADSFSIDWATGQLMTKGALDFEMETSHTVMVRATDPAGVPQAQAAVEDNSDEITVTITVTNVNEPPAVTGDAAVMFEELVGNIVTELHDYAADDPETQGGNNDSDVTWSVAGDDGSKFDVSDDGMLTFKDKPDFEAPTDANKNNIYEVTVRAADSDGNRGEKAVKVTVMNEEEDGVVTLSRTQIRVGVPVTASLSDPDGSISGLTWQWYDDTVDESDLTQNAIEDANSATYTPVAGDVGNTLRARASYTDGEGEDNAVGTAASDVTVDTRNRAPVFQDQDAETDGVQNESTTRKVAENTKALADDDAADATDAAGDNVGGVVTATDPDPNTEDLIYTLGGADADKFRVRSNGQIEVGAGTELDYETKDTYMVTVMAEDSFGESSSIMVTITVTDVDEAPEIMLGGLAIGGSNNIEYAENGMDAVGTYMASGPDANMATWSLSGDDMSAFSLSNNRELMFRNSPDYENPTDADMDNVYVVTIMADDGTYRDTHDVMVMVTNEDEDGTVTLSTMRPAVGEDITATLTDLDSPDGVTGTTWQWARSDAMDGTFTNIPEATSMNNYTPIAGDVGMYLRATASYADGEGSGKSEDAVTANAVAAVAAEGGLLATYDSDRDDEISKDEFLVALDDYFDENIEKDTMLEVLDLYFDSGS